MIYYVLGPRSRKKKRSIFFFLAQGTKRIDANLTTSIVFMCIDANLTRSIVFTKLCLLYLPAGQNY